MGPKDVVAKLKKIDKRLRVVWSANKVSGLYFLRPGHPDAKPNGLVHIGAIASASWFFTLPMKDFYTKKDRVWLGGVPPGESTMDWEYHRGWKSTVKLLVEQGHFDRFAIGKAFGWDAVVAGVGGILSRLPGFSELTKGQQAKKSLGMDYGVPRALPGPNRRLVVQR